MNFNLRLITQEYEQNKYTINTCHLYKQNNPKMKLSIPKIFDYSKPSKEEIHSLPERKRKYKLSKRKKNVLL